MQNNSDHETKLGPKPERATLPSVGVRRHRAGRTPLLATPVALLVALTASCGGDDNNSSNGAVTTTPSSPTVPGSASSTSPTTMSPSPSPTETSPGVVTGSPTVGPTPTPTDPTAVGGTATNGPTGGVPTVMPSGPGTVPSPAAGGAPPVGPDGEGGSPPAGGGAGGMGAGGDTSTAMDPVPTANGSTYSFTVDDVTFTADGPSGRVTGLMFGGSNILTTSAVHDTNYGSSFWTSPQDWDWPPAIDGASYTHSIDGDSIVFVSEEVTLATNDVTVTKRFKGRASDGSVELQYTVTNTGSGALDFAPWEITRVFNDGFTFYPRGTNDPHAQTGEYSPEAIPTVTLGDDMVWYDFSGNDGESKSVSDGAEGWLAHVSGGVLLLKVFEDVPVSGQFDTEGEIEVYSAPDDAYVELEQQAARQTVAAGETSTPWTVHWYVRTVPAEVDESVGSESLVSWVREVVGAASP